MGSGYSLTATVFFQARGIKQFCKSGYEKHSKNWNPKDLDVDMSERVAMVTGANSGLGYVVAEELAKRKTKVVMICRNKERGQKALEDLKKSTGNDNIELHILDISRPAQIRNFARQYINSGGRLDVLINNAGALLNKREETEDAIETTFASHTLGAFLMTEYLLPVLKKSPAARVITVTSGGMYTQKMNDDYESKKSYDGTRSYAQCKRHQVYLNQIWAKQHADTNVTFYTVHPGWARTPGTQSALPSWFDKLDLRTPQQGADTIVWLAIAESVAKESGKLWFDREVAEIHMPVGNTQSTEKEIQDMHNYCLEYKNKFEKEETSEEQSFTSVDETSRTSR